VRPSPVPTRLLVAALLALAAAPAPAAELRISWDQDLAAEADRAGREARLRELVQRSEAEVAAWLGWPRTRPLEVKVVTRARYEAEHGSAVASVTGARYARGVIEVNGGARLDGWFAGVVSHELTHALLDDRRSIGRLPIWLNEGLAERLGARARGREGLDAAQVRQLEAARQQRTLVPLLVSGSLTEPGYLQAHAAVLFLEQQVGREKLLAVVRRVLERGTLDEALDAELRWTVGTLEAGFASWVDRLRPAR
jgi:hypothetical protein